MNIHVEEFDKVLVRRLGRRGATVTYIAFIICGLAVLSGVAVNQWRGTPPPIAQSTVVEKQSVKPPEPDAKPTNLSVLPGIGSEIAVSLDTAEVKWGKQDDGFWTVQALVHVSSKFQRSGLVLHFRSNLIADIPQPLQMLPVNGQPTYHGKYVAKDWSYSHYVQRPWGQYVLSLRMKEKSDVVFTYRFEGEKEAPHVTWKAP